jgi:superfamily II DNA helicase RecQ
MILPLLNLGAEQCKKIACFEGARPCEVTGQTKSRDPSLFDCIEKLHYNYILLGPEQAVSKEFKQILKSPSFNSQLGLIVVDEAHLTRQWASFRVAYTYLHLLRDLLPPSVPLLACSATLDPTTLEAMKKHVGIKDRGMHIIRTSVDRPDIAIIIQTIQKNKVSTFIDLYFILRGAVDDNKRATPENIPKTIIFLDNINLIHDCAAKLQEWLVEMTKDCVDETERFTYAKAAACIRVYHSRVGPCDQEDIYRISGVTLHQFASWLHASTCLMLCASCSMV